MSKKNFKCMLVMMMAAILSVGLVSCGDDEVNPSTNSPSNPNPDNMSGSTYSFQGEGSEEVPYVISTANDLKGLAYNVNHGITYRDECFMMNTDIVLNRNVLNEDGDLNGDGSNFEQWQPIGNEKNQFCGTFDGCGHSVYGIYINKDDDDFYGLFGVLAGTVKNLKLKDSYVKGKKCGGIAGKTTSYSPNGNTKYKACIQKCYNYATIEGPVCVGGIIALFSQGKIDRNVNFGKIIGAGITDMGGICGDVDNCSLSVSDCGNYGTITTNKYYYGGGIFGGICTHALNIKNCFNGGSSGRGISWDDLNLGSNLVNYGKTSGYTICTNYGVNVTNAYWWEGSGSQDTSIKTKDVFERIYTSTWTNWAEMTEKEMKSQSFLDKLNENARKLGSEYSLWKFGKDGWPILEWIEED